MEKKVTPAWTIALITTLVLVLFDIIIYVSNQLMNKSLKNIPLLIILVVVIVSNIYYAKQMNGQVTYGNVFAYGFKITAGIAALIAIYTAISIKFIHPEFVEMSLDLARTELEKSGKLSTDKIDSLIGMTKENFLSFTIASLTFFIALIGFIASLIGAGLAKKNPISPFENAS
jgi:Protein of unknown function (DUF4199)